MEFDEKHRFIHDILYARVKNRNIGFDSHLIPHVSPEDFEVVLDHCAETGSGICGIEIFDVSRWKKDHQVASLDVVIRPEEGLEWARRLVREYAGQPNITVCASCLRRKRRRPTRSIRIGINSTPIWKKALGGGIRKRR